MPRVIIRGRASGEVIWRSDSSADRIIGATEEVLYVRDRQGRFLVFDAKNPTNPAKKYSAALAGIDLAEFNVHIVNTASDRVYLAADNGLIVCLRDMNAKYARPVRICPEPMVNLIPAAAVDVPPGEGEPKKDAGMKKN
jgi:hypothetical protein